MKLAYPLSLCMVAVIASSVPAADGPATKPATRPVAQPRVIQIDPNNPDKVIRIDPNDPNKKIEIKQPEKKKVEPKISAGAKPVLEKITAAYKKINGLELAGTLSAQIDLGGEKQSRSASIKGLFQAPNKFRHEINETGDADSAETMIVGSTGESLYVFRPEAAEYRSAPAPKDRVASSKMPRPMRDLLEMQDPGLMCAIVDDAGQFLAEDNLEVNGPVDVKIGGKTFVALDFKGEKSDFRAIVDPRTWLVRQIVLDLKKTIESAGRSDVNKFVMTFDYTTSKVDPAVKPDAFAWAAPDGAREVTATAADDERELIVQSAGKEAPDFTLKGMDGKEVSLKDHKGSVVVIDFWATWCGPCKVSLPGLNKIYKDLKDKGLVVYAIDLQEPKDKVQAVANNLKLDIPVLLDEKSEVGNKYGVNGIPHTVVIGKDQKIVKVFVGAGNDEKIRAAVEAAMK